MKYAALSTGTIDHVWYDEDSASARTGKRTNRIRMTRDMSVKSTTMDTYDA
ncbi:MAG: hypothetical protein ACOYNL_10575 [Rickettsiales bacterium]